MILITGGNGFVGSQVVRELLDLGHRPVVFDPVPPPGQAAPGKTAGANQITWVRGNILNLPELLDALQRYGVQAVIHLAAYRNVDSQANPFGAFRLIVEGTMNVLEAARLAGCRRVVLASSVAVYGSPHYYQELGLDPFAVTEQYPVRPANVYGATKAFCEQMMEQYRQLGWLEPVAVRLPIILGPGKKAGSQTSFFNDLLVSAARGLPSRVESFGGQVFNFIYVRDAAHALVRAALAEAPPRTVYNCGGQRTDIAGLAAAVRAAVPGAEVEVVATPDWRPWSSAIVDDLARAELGYSPRYTLVQAVEDYIRTGE